jgi:hypothetical protein
MLAITLVGLFVFCTLSGTLTTGVECKLDELRNVVHDPDQMRKVCRRGRL